MCVAAPGRIVALDGDTARVDFSGNVLEVNVALLPAKVGDYVLTHAGMAIEIMDEERAMDLIDLFREIEEAAGGGSH